MVPENKIHHPLLTILSLRAQMQTAMYISIYFNRFSGTF